MAANFPYDSIAQMGAWDFWARPSSLNLDPDDAEYAQADPAKAPEDAQQRILAAASSAAVVLRDSESSPFRRPS